MIEFWYFKCRSRLDEGPIYSKKNEEKGDFGLYRNQAPRKYLNGQNDLEKAQLIDPYSPGEVEELKKAKSETRIFIP